MVSVQHFVESGKTHLDTPRRSVLCLAVKELSALLHQINP